MTETLALIIIAACAVILTVRTLFIDFMSWLARRYHNRTPPEWAQALGALVAGGRRP